MKYKSPSSSISLSPKPKIKLPLNQINNKNRKIRIHDQLLSETYIKELGLRSVLNEYKYSIDPINRLKLEKEILINHLILEGILDSLKKLGKKTVDKAKEIVKGKAKGIKDKATAVATLGLLVSSEKTRKEFVPALVGPLRGRRKDFLNYLIKYPKEILDKLKTFTALGGTFAKIIDGMKKVIGFIGDQIKKLLELFEGAANSTNIVSCLRSLGFYLFFNWVFDQEPVKIFTKVINTILDAFKKGPLKTLSDLVEDELKGQVEGGDDEEGEKEKGPIEKFKENFKEEINKAITALTGIDFSAAFEEIKTWVKVTVTEIVARVIGAAATAGISEFLAQAIKFYKNQKFVFDAIEYINGRVIKPSAITASGSGGSSS